MKIALVIPSIPKYSETFLTNKIAGLKASGFGVVLMVVGVSEKVDLGVPIKYQPILAAHGLQRWVYTFWLILLSVLRTPFRVSKLLRATKKLGYSLFGRWRMVAVLSNFLTLKNTDWIHFAYGTMAVERAFIGQVIGAKVGMSLRGYDISIAPVLRPNMYKNVWPFVDKVHSISKDLVEVAKQQGLPRAMPVEIIHPAIDAEKFSCVDRHFNHQPLRILSVGRLHWKKGLEYTLQALALWGGDFEFTIIGDGEERERLIFAAYQLGIAERVSFVGQKEHHQVCNAMQQHDVLLQFSLQEGFCNTVLEAQAAGILCVVSDAEGLPENVLHNQTGFVVPKRDVSALAKQLQYIQQMDKQAEEELTERAVARVARKFDLTQQAQEFKAFYEQD